MPSSKTIILVDAIASVTKAIGFLYGSITNRLSVRRYPQELVNGVSTIPARVEGESVIGTVKIEAPQALAYEYGSGIWSELGPRAKYLIEPVNASKLVFDWPDAESISQREGINLVNFGPGGRVGLPRVFHPGVQAKPYVQPGINDALPGLLDELGTDFLISISASMGPDFERL